MKKTLVLVNLLRKKLSSRRLGFVAQKHWSLSGFIDMNTSTNFHSSADKIERVVINLQELDRPNSEKVTREV